MRTVKVIKILIIDDEPKAGSVLQHYLRSYVREIKEVRIAHSAQEAWQILEKYKPDIVFLDIEMPQQNGFDFLKGLKSHPFDIIFTTAFNQYAIQAIRFSALDYLLKPIDPDELVRAVGKHLARKESIRQKKELYDNLLRNIQKKDIKDFRIGIPSSEGVFFFSITEILRLEADRNYTVFYFTDKRPFIASKTLKYFEDMLEQFKFVRTHKSHLINVSQVVHLGKNHDYLVMSDGEKIEISRRKKDRVLRLLNLT